jgi:hypothetical protein
MRHCHSHSYAKGLDTLRQLGFVAGQGPIGHGLDTATRTHAHTPTPGPAFSGRRGGHGGTTGPPLRVWGYAFLCQKSEGHAYKDEEGPSEELRVSIHPKRGRGASLALLGVTHGHTRHPDQPTEQRYAG